MKKGKPDRNWLNATWDDRVRMDTLSQSYGPAEKVRGKVMVPLSSIIRLLKRLFK